MYKLPIEKSKGPWKNKKGQMRNPKGALPRGEKDLIVDRNNPTYNSDNPEHDHGWKASQESIKTNV